MDYEVISFVRSGRRLTERDLKALEGDFDPGRAFIFGTTDDGRATVHVEDDEGYAHRLDLGIERQGGFAGSPLICKKILASSELRGAVLEIGYFRDDRDLSNKHTYEE